MLFKNSTSILIILATLTLAVFSPAKAQEIRLSVDLNTSQISSSDYDYIGELKTLIEEYVNDRRWTNDTFDEDERIEMRMNIVLVDDDGNANFDATVVVQSFRPIYNTVTRTPLLILNDTNWRFNFSRGRNISFDENNFDDLASFIDFYVNIVLAYDYDSFSPLGGNEFLRRAENVVNVAQSGGGAQGWSSSGRRGRHQLISLLRNQRYEGVRMAQYKYHRLGLDLFTINPERARNNIYEALTLLRETQRQTTERYLFDLIFSAKYREFTAAFLDAETDIRLDAYNLLVDLDSSHISEYEKLQ